VKQLATILLLLLLLFNFVGYRLLFDVLQQKANKELVAKLDNNQYNDADLITLTVPLSMPYLADSKDFERKGGEIAIGGKIYHYVKQKISHGNLILKCVPDEQKMHLQNAKDNFFKLANELQNNSNTKNSGDHSQVIKLVISDYIETEVAANAFAVNNTVNTYTDNYSSHLQKGETLIPEQPPKA
jgi:sulfur relay (sulfurtransferase) DsrC/TusE family protein